MGYKQLYERPISMANKSDLSVAMCCFLLFFNLSHALGVYIYKQNKTLFFCNKQTNPMHVNKTKQTHGFDHVTRK